MGLFDRSRQTTTTNTAVYSTVDNSSSVVQDSGNTITSITDAFKTSISGFDTIVSQPVAIQAGGGSGGSFDMNSFFRDVTPEKASGSSPGFNPAPLIVLAVITLVGWFLWKRLRK